MPEKPLDDLHKRLEAIFTGLFDTKTLQPPEHRTISYLGEGYPRGWVWELNHDDEIIWCSPEVESLLGYDSDDLIGQSIFSIIDEPQSRQQLQTAFNTRNPIFNMELVGKMKDGQSIIMLLNAVVQQGEPSDGGYRGVIHVFENRSVSDHMRMFDSQFFEQELDLTPITLGWESVPGYSLQDGSVSPTERYVDLEIPDESIIENGVMKVPILGQQDTPLGIVQFERGAEDPNWTEGEKELVSAVTQQLALALQDARSNQLTQQALEEIRLADQLKSQFLANVSHELRTPLNSIIGFSRVILKGIDGPITDTQKQDLTAIYNAGQHLLGLINNILDFSKIESGKMELSISEIDLSEIVGDVTATTVGLIKDKPIELVVDMPEVLPPVYADGIRTRQILLNLVSNAAKFTDEGKIGISVRLREDEDKDEVLVSVFDTGPGIAIEDQERIFEPFSQVDASPTRRTGGTGLGLSICRHLVELQGGKIWVESAPGEGSTFAFTIPTRAETFITEGGIEPLILGIHHADEDQERIREMIEGAGYRIRMISDTSVASTLASNLAPALILIDPTLPNGQGWELLAQLKSNEKTFMIPINTFTYLEDPQLGINHGVGDYITSPIKSEELEAAINFLIGDKKVERNTLIIDDIQDALNETREVVEGLITGTVRCAASGFEALVAARQQVPDLIIINLFMANADGFRMTEAIRIDDRTLDIPVIVIFPEELSDLQLRQLELWTDHCAKNAAIPVDRYFENLFNRIENIQPEEIP
ncbi:MAG: response regulator [Anaerolineales bacterium]|nr:response regulator [Anaerolineales bacterium]